MSLTVRLLHGSFLWIESGRGGHGLESHIALSPLVQEPDRAEDYRHNHDDRDCNSRLGPATQPGIG